MHSGLSGGGYDWKTEPFADFQFSPVWPQPSPEPPLLDPELPPLLDPELLPLPLDPELLPLPDPEPLELPPEPLLLLSEPELLLEPLPPELLLEPFPPELLPLLEVPDDPEEPEAEASSP
jgi:hypothetical protein